MVLGIKNRTENWKTARYLSMFFGHRAALLARRLDGNQAPPTKGVTLELYWKGVRDWCAGKDKRDCKDRLVRSYRRLFPDLHERIEQYGGFRDLKNGAYTVSSEDQQARMFTNLFNTEIDIVLESPQRLYIGEAKFKSGFHANSRLVLVHQLVRQYVMANVLVDVLGRGKEIVPFVVVEATWTGPGLDRRPHQVRFMVDEGWMSEANCLTWDALATIATGRPEDS